LDKRNKQTAFDNLRSPLRSGSLLACHLDYPKGKMVASRNSNRRRRVNLPGPAMAACLCLGETPWHR